MPSKRVPVSLIRPFVSMSMASAGRAEPDLEVIGIVRRSDLHCAGAEFGVDVLVGDDRAVTVEERGSKRPADQMAVPLVVGVHGDRGVAQHGLDPGGRDDDGLVVAIDP